MKNILFALMVPALVCFALTATAQEEGGLVRQPLDLPAAGQAGQQDDEDAPESITFYGSEIEGDGFFFCFPAYAFCGITDEFYAITDEVADSINALSSRSWFDLVAYNSQPYVWSQRARRATNGNKAAANAWMSTLSPTESCIITDAGLTTIRICNQTRRAQRKQMIFLGGNKPSDSTSALDSLTSANTKRVPIHTVFVAAVYSNDQGFWAQLASLNGGTTQTIN